MGNRGTTLKPKNTFERYSYDTLEEDEWIASNAKDDSIKTEFIPVQPKTIVNKLDSPDVGLSYSLNPYQGCEHGCIYCYARNSHEYWGYNAGVDFESKILVKHQAPKLFEQFINRPKWQNFTIGISGNTDCYQPIERKLKLTQHILNIANTYNQCVAMITKNSLILRDLDIIKKMAEKNLIMIYISITGTDEGLRKKLEPRTATYAKRFETLKILADNHIPCGVMVAPIIPGINDNQIGKVLKLASSLGVDYAAYTIVRLQKQIAGLFQGWLKKHYPERQDKVLNLIKNVHGGQLHNSNFHSRMKGEGVISDMISNQFKIFVKKYNFNQKRFEYNRTLFIRKDKQLNLFS